jgi:hypothetical protein
MTATKTLWTIAYRKPKANRFQRITNWSGTWHQAVEVAVLFNDTDPGLQVFYVPSAASEDRLRAELADEVARGDIDQEFADRYLVDMGNVLTDTGRRVRIVERGELPAETLAKVPSPIQAEARWYKN